MMSDKQISEYLFIKLMVDIETERTTKWFRETVSSRNIEFIRSKQFRNELERRFRRVHEFLILTDTFHHIKHLLDRYNNEVGKDKNETP